MADISGFCDDRFGAVREAFAANFDQGVDVGASVAVHLDGEPVVDLWGGFADRDRTVPWERDTIINVWSTTKTMTFVAALLLADRGELDLDAPVARYWPEFAANGKEGVLVRHVMGHTAGLSGWQEKVAPEDLYDWDKMTSLLAAQEPWWEPGNGSGYHAITQGYLVGELVRRVTDQSFGTFFRTEIAEPLGADFHVGFGPELDDRVAIVITPPRPERPEEFPPMMLRTMTNPLVNAKQSWERAWRQAEIPAAGGHGNARSVAAVQSVLSAGGEARGVRLFSEAVARRVLEEQAYGPDMVIGDTLRFGIGYGLRCPELPIGRGDAVAFWGGYGGSLIVNDLDHRLTIAYVMNKMELGTVGGARSYALVDAAYDSLGA
ncbi:MAG: serine hydrolase domain-containing protein [Acidimicrobiales bacterium]